MTERDAELWRIVILSIMLFAPLAGLAAVLAWERFRHGKSR